MKDYKDFSQADKKPTPTLNQAVLSMVEKDLNPAHSIVFFKLTAVQGFIGFLTLALCPQFNFSLTNNYDLFHYFHMNFGHAICMILCGSIFLGSGAIFASYLLSQGEIIKIKNSRFLYYMAQSIVAVSVFLLAGAEIYLHLVSYWMVGAVFGGMLFFELNRLIRNSLYQGEYHG